MELRTLTNAELLRIADHQFNAISGTDLELELIRRLQAADDAFASHEPLIDVLAELDIEDPAVLRKNLEALGDMPAEQVTALLDALADFDIDQADTLRKRLERADTLRKRLERADEFDQAMEDPAEFIASLQTLTTTE